MVLKAHIFVSVKNRGWVGGKVLTPPRSFYKNETVLCEQGLICKDTRSIIKFNLENVFLK
jgi:hypothetical protein